MIDMDKDLDLDLDIEKRRAEQYPFTTTPEERQQRRAERIAARRERQRRQRRKLLLRLLPVAALLLAVGGFGISWALGHGGEEPPEGGDPVGEELTAAPQQTPDPEEVAPEPPYSLSADQDTRQLGEELNSQYAILIDLENDRIAAQKSADVVVSPASMTKIMTVLVAAEAITDASQLQDTVTIDLEITDYSYVNGCSTAGFLLGEAVPVEELFYGTILPSGGDAALALARYIAGSQEDFVQLMNRKAEALGLGDTARFANCVGLYDENNVCTVYDMALILKAALDNDLCRQVLTARTRQIPANDEHPDGMLLSNWFLRRIEDHVSEGVEVLGAKTGYVVQSGNCAASYARVDGREYICVTADAPGSWACIRDHVAIYDSCRQ